MMASKVQPRILGAFLLFLLAGQSTFSLAAPSFIPPIEGQKSIAMKQAQIVSNDAATQSPVPTQSILLAQNAAGTQPAGRSDIIAEINVEGSQRVDPATVISYMRLKVGEPYEREKLDESLKSLFSTGYFRDVQFRLEGSVLIVQVKENPVINRIAFEGNIANKDETLEPELKLKPRTVYTISKLQSDVERIIQIYRRGGRYSVKVEPKIIELDQNRVDIVFEITEGDITKVHRIVFIGNKRFSDSQLRSVISTSESRWYRFLTSSDVYDPDRLEYDQNVLRQYYLRNGYIDFEVISAVAELTPRRDGFIITFTLDEGDRFNIASVGIKSGLLNVDMESLEKEIKLSVGDHYNSQLVDETINDLTKKISNSGATFFEITPKVKRRVEDTAVDVVFDITEGQRVYIDKIDIMGNVRTLDSVIRREMRLSEGDAFNLGKIRESERRLGRLGFFESVKIDSLPSKNSDRVTLAVNVVEKSTGELSFGAGLSSDSGLLGNASIRERNLLGKGQNLALSFGVSLQDNQIDLSFTEPYFLNRPLSAGVDIFASEQDRESESAYSERAAGLGLRVGYELAPRWQQTWGYLLKDSDITASTGASRFILAQDGRSTTSKVTHKLSYDNTDNFFDPSEGLRLSWNVGVAGLGGSVSYLNSEAKASQFFPLAEETVIQLSTRAGAIFGFDQDVRLVDRYFLGGTNFRGFAFSGIGARDTATGDALGGNYYYQGTAELTFPLGLNKEVGIRGRAFIDVGSVFDTDDDGVGVRDSKDPRVSVGVGLTWASVLGPLRLDFGYAVLKEDFDEEQVFSFSFGTRF